MNDQALLPAPQRQEPPAGSTNRVFLEKFEEVIGNLKRRAYQLFRARGSKDGQDLGDWLQAEEELLAPVPVKMTEQHNQLRLLADVEDFSADELAYKLEKTSLTILALKQSSTEQNDYSACTSRMIYRTIQLPFEVAPEKAEARFKNGTLEITAPKAVMEKAIPKAA